MAAQIAIDPALVPKNSREQLRLAVDEFRGHLLLSARIWFTSAGGDLRPSREGWAIAIERLPEIIAALQRLEADARAAGMLEPR
jgi:hypothetical protein